MREGRKQLARQLVEKAFENIKRKQIERYHLTKDPEKRSEIELDPLKVFHKALLNVRPLLELQPVRRGGVTYQVIFFRFCSRFNIVCWLISIFVLGSYSGSSSACEYVVDEVDSGGR